MPDLATRVEVRFEKHNGKVVMTLPNEGMVDDAAFLVCQLPGVEGCRQPAELQVCFEPAQSADNQPVEPTALIDRVMQTLVDEFDDEEFGGTEVWCVGDFSSNHVYVPRLRAATN